MTTDDSHIGSHSQHRLSDQVSANTNGSTGTNVMSERFTETLRAANEAGWSHAVQHRFVNELFAGAVPDVVMARYLIQDHRFLDSFLVLLGAALASADTFAARLRFGRFIGIVSAEENTYFLRAFEALGVTETRRVADPDTQPTIGFKAIMREAADTRSYAAALSVLVVAEWLYLDWASRAPQPLPNKFVHAEWITLSAAQGLKVRRLPAGERWIRTSGSAYDANAGLRRKSAASAACRRRSSAAAVGGDQLRRKVKSPNRALYRARNRKFESTSLQR